MLHASFFRCSCTSNMAFVILKIKSKNYIKSWEGLMVEGKHTMNALYHLYATGNLDKDLCPCVVVPYWTNCYTYMYVYDIVWRADGDESLSVCVRLQWIRGGEATVDITLFVCSVRLCRYMYGFAYNSIRFLQWWKYNCEIICVDILNKRHEQFRNVCNVHRSCYCYRVATPLWQENRQPIFSVDFMKRIIFCCCP